MAIAILPASSRASLAAQRGCEERDAKTRALRTVLQDEPELDAAFSVRMGNELIIWAFRNDTLVAMGSGLRQARRIASFAQRVLARV